MDVVARIAAGADAMGIGEIFSVREPFRIAERALEWMSLKASVHLLDVPLDHSAEDSARGIQALVKEGISHVVSLGGDGTQRVLAKTAPNIYLIPLSTGTNNVFPLAIEPTFAGMAGALGARGLLPLEDLTRRAKVAHFSIADRVKDMALIDVGRVENDFVGNLRPFKAENIQELILTRALPGSIGMSPIGGLIDPLEECEDQGLYVRLGSGREIPIPVAPGQFRNVQVEEAKRINLGEQISLGSLGLIEVDGDRLYRIGPNESVKVTIRRDGPHVYDVSAAMHHIATHRLLEAKR